MHPRIAIALVALSPLVSAQWPAYKTPAPRTADGRVDMNAPAPKTADGKPDLTGVWDRGMPPGAPPPAASPFAGGAPPGAQPPPNAPRPKRPFQDLPSLFPDTGLPMLPWAADLRKQRLAENSKDHPDAHCLPLSPVQLHTHPQPRKIVQTPTEVVIVYEANNGLRQIFTDGRSLPKADEVQPWWFGYSTGHWEGDTLVAQTIGLRDMGWLDEEGTPYRESLKVTERFRRPNFGTLEIGITIDDPQTFTKPWSYQLTQRLMPDTDLFEFVCSENNRSTSHLVGK